MAKLWQKSENEISALAKKVEAFTVGKDLDADLLLAPYDVIGSLAHAQMLSETGLLDPAEFQRIRAELKLIYLEIVEGDFTIAETSEDIHSEIEFRLTKKLGETGKKIHSGRSRNDQVLTDIKLFSCEGIETLVFKIKKLFDTLIQLSNTHKDKLLPGYTHLQLAMPSSFGLWFGAYAESLVDDVELLYAAFKLANKNPLGSGAGYGGSLPINRERTTELLGFAALNYNVVYAQMNRGKMEKAVANAMGSVAATLSRMAMDCCLYMNQNFSFISFPDDVTTGSSIMPHKKNPDVWELIRAHCNKLQNLPAQISSIQANLPSGYHRDFQVIKQDYLAAFEELGACLDMADLMMELIIIKDHLLDDDRYRYLFTVEAVNELVNKGIPFREAYAVVARQVADDSFMKPDKIRHTHAGSIGNLCNEEISGMMDKALARFPFGHMEDCLSALLQ